MVKMGIDVGFGRVKGIASNGRRVNFRSAIGEFQPVKFNSGMVQNQELSTAIEYQGRSIYIGAAALKQTTPEATIDSRRTVTYEGISLLLAAMSFLTPGQISENIQLVVGLPLQHYARLKDDYIKAAETLHQFNELSFSGNLKLKKYISVSKVKVLPQPFGTLFNLILDNNGEIINTALADGKVGIIDNGYNTADYLRVEGLEYIEPRSKSYSEMGVYAVCKSLSEKLYREFEVEIPPEQIEPYLDQDTIKIRGQEKRITDLKTESYRAEATNIISRAKSLWPDYALLDSIPLTGGGMVRINDFLTKELGETAVITANPMWENAEGYLKFAKRVWKL